MLRYIWFVFYSFFYSEKKTFLANAEIAMEPSKAVKEYKEELIKSQKQNERLTTLVGKVTVSSSC
jgi:hypothetical protein